MTFGRGGRILPMSTPGSLLGLRDLGREYITAILDRAEELLPVVDGQSGPDVAGSLPAVVGLLFLEDSTRTRGSFEIAVHRLGHRPVTLTGGGSSASKGESLLDTAKNLVAMGSQAIVVRTSRSGGASHLDTDLDVPIINAGDGRHEHPTQALLDASTLRFRLGSLEGKRIAIVGDVLNSRVARSNIYALHALGAQVLLVGPPSLVPWRLADMLSGGDRPILVAHDFDAILDSVDAVMMLRIQRERDAGRAISADYRHAFGMTVDRAARLGTEVPILHPGPVNRGVELDDAVLDRLDRSLVLEQVRRGTAVRMSVLARALAEPVGI